MHDRRARPRRAGAWSLWSVFAASKSTLAVSLVTGVIAGAASAGLLDLLTRGIAAGREQTTEVVVGFFLLCVVFLASSAASLLLLSRLAQDNLFHLRLGLARRILETPLHVAEAHGAHRLLAVLTEDANSIVAAQKLLPTLVIEGAKVVAVFVYLLWLSPLLCLFILLYVGVVLCARRPALTRAQGWLDSARRTENALFGALRSLVEGGKELRMNARRRRAFLDEELARAADDFRGHSIKAQTSFVLVERSSDTLFFLFLGLLLFLVPRFLAVAPETLTGFALGTMFLSGPLGMVGAWLPIIGKGVAAMRNIEAMGLAEPAVAAPVDRAALPPGAIELRGVTYRRRGPTDDSSYDLGPIDLRIEPGEILFVTGGNGGGKTTLALVLLGLFAPDMGEIRIGGRPVAAADREAYRQNFAAVFADAHVFEALLGYSDEPSRRRAEELLERLRLAEKVEVRDGRFSTVELSRGQRKRLALLAACLEDRPILVFDEWAAEQDPAFREMFYRRLLPELKASGKTIIAISHDDRYFSSADRVLRMSCGRIEREETPVVDETAGSPA
ncbi:MULTISPECIES: cyclic peptide export ABC transporter [Methylosinus]|uniref:Cyclic peptide transporter n=1 Tax=Methylosinus trichosporium (strain ATCC 35070 / NCIMB 11131 / UNIQEM 75 / OB3b) TaxID=595536 RepID=A0A2D2CWU7_METT3|nr:MULTISPECIES: cyclic peptide export ABC transporter [Methylosinus]ATQ67231.1 cyclic peptide transporter [Methylosinus trichosporium OB3b]